MGWGNLSLDYRDSSAGGKTGLNRPPSQNMKAVTDRLHGNVPGDTQRLSISWTAGL